MTHDYVRHLAEGMVREVCFLGMLPRLDADRDELIGDAAFSGYQGYAARASGLWVPVKLECHGEHGG